MLFGGLVNELELSEGARVLSTSNVWVSAGIMNGTAGTVRAIVYRRGDRPDHEDVRRRQPHVILVECPQFTGAPFFDESKYPERRQWVPFFPREAKEEHDNAITRTQYALTLAWALTPWKAQGMTLERLIVRLDT